MADKEVQEEVIDEYDSIIFDDGRIYVEREGEEEGEEKEMKEYYPDYKMAREREYNKEVYEDIRKMGEQSTLFDKMSFGRFCEYVEQAEGTQDKYNWAECNPEEHMLRYYGKIRPTFKQWVRHFIMELMELFEYMMRTYVLELGSFECFMTECYTQSSSAERIPLS